MSSRVIISGDPGTYYVNNTETILYQFHVAGINTCAICWQYSEQIARYWPIPLHRMCRCRQSVLRPGQRATNPFVDYQELILKLSVPQQAAVMGKSAFKLWRRGVIDWKDAVTPSRIRTLREIVSIKNLSIEQLIKHSVAPAFARAAWSATHTAEHAYAEQHRKALIERILKAGVPHEAMIRQMGERLAARVAIAAGPSVSIERAKPPTPALGGKTALAIPGLAATSSRPAWAASQLPGIGTPERRQSHRDELAAILGSQSRTVGNGPGSRGNAAAIPIISRTRVAMGQTTRLSDQNRAIVEAELGPEAGRSIAAFMLVVAERRRSGLPISEKIERLAKRYEAGR